ncbi:hypothetical protein [Methylocaldum sp.]|uniref:hypothetical protein n=1 Tax=Methylocaldum sp. TaxID=1969727 RepID=UPI002D6DF831|nr:hypothetical protein [Methylocaldum sp.]HYE37206.1 hypothetical protein [Methylocaldum sp.]
MFLHELIRQGRQLVVQTLGRVVVGVFEPVQRNLRTFFIVDHMDKEKLFDAGTAVYRGPEGFSAIREFTHHVAS